MIRETTATDGRSVGVCTRTNDQGDDTIDDDGGGGGGGTFVPEPASLALPGVGGLMPLPRRGC